MQFIGFLGLMKKKNTKMYTTFNDFKYLKFWGSFDFNLLF